MAWRVSVMPLYMKDDKTDCIYCTYLKKSNNDYYFPLEKKSHDMPGST